MTYPENSWITDCHWSQKYPDYNIFRRIRLLSPTCFCISSARYELRLITLSPRQRDELLLTACVGDRSPLTPTLLNYSLALTSTDEDLEWRCCSIPLSRNFKKNAFLEIDILVASSGSAHFLPSGRKCAICVLRLHYKFRWPYMKDPIDIFEAELCVRWE